VLLVAAILAIAGCRALAAQRKTVNRVIASVDGTAITLSDAARAYRFEFWLEGKSPPDAPDAAALTLARDRLIDQTLLLREADAENITVEDSGQAATEALAEVRKKFGDEEAFQLALRALHMTEEQVTGRLRDRDRILRLIDRRLRPSAQVEQSEIEAYYRNIFVPDYARRGEGPAPALGEVESQVREILVQKRMNELLEAWLSNLKSNHRVKLYSF